MNDIINQIINNFDFSYIVSINFLTYTIIKIIDYFNGDKKVSTLIKRLCLIIAIILITTIYVILGYNNYIILVNSAIAAPICWSWLLKSICNKLNIDYKKDL